MKTLILCILYTFCIQAFADTKISQLPLKSASDVVTADALPYVNTTLGETDRIELYDLVNLAPFQTQFASMVPSQTGNSGLCLKTNGTVTSWGTCQTSSSQAANLVFAGPSSGSPATPTFRSLVGADLPNPSSSVLGGVQSAASQSHKWINTISTSGVPGLTQPACGDLSDSVASCNTDATNASNISSGTLGAARLPNPSSSTLGGIQSYAGTSHQWISSISTLGVPASTQPAFTDISGSATIAQAGTGITTYATGDTLYASASNTLSKLSGNTTTTKKYLAQTGTGTASQAPAWTQPACGDLSDAVASCNTDATNASNISSGTLGSARLPTPGASTLGGIESYAAVTHQWINTISTSGVPSSSRPACADLSDSVASCNTDATNASNISTGTLPAARLPNPSSSTLGGIESLASVSHKWINTISTSGVPSATQPACGDLSDSVASCNTDTTNAGNISSGTLAVARGGTGVSSWTTYAPVAAGTTSTGNFQSLSSGMSNSGYVLTSNGSSAAPTWQAPGSPTFSGLTANAVLYASSTTTVATVAGTGTSGQVMTSNGSGSAPTMQTVPGNSTVLKGPTRQTFTSTGTLAGYLFTTSVATVGVGCVFSSNAHNYTVVQAMSPGNLMWATGASGAAASGTLTYVSGGAGCNGAANLSFTLSQAFSTYTTPTSPSPLWIRVRVAGAGGGGGTLSSSGHAGSNGTGSYFGPGIMNVSGGTGGPLGGVYVAGGAGGGATSGIGSSIQCMTGQAGGPTNDYPYGGGAGGNNPGFGGGGPGGPYSISAATYEAATTNSGGGGGGGGSSSVPTQSGGGGGAGGYCEGNISSPSATYYYVVGTGGAGGSQASYPGGNGADGIIIVDEYYQ